jgi:hypothetical protein
MMETGKPRQLLHPLYVMRLLEQMTDAEAGELDKYASAGTQPDDYPVRASEWLRRRFGLDRHTNS